MSHASNLTLKFTGGGGFLGSILTTLDSTLGGGRKLFLPTCGYCGKLQLLFTDYKSKSSISKHLKTIILGVIIDYKVHWYVK